jgi:Fic family protein
VKPYEPKQLPLDNIDWPAHVTLIGQANAALARYDGMLQSIINPAVLLSPLTTQEAVLSSRIEGTQASIEDVLEFEAGSQESFDPSRRADIQEILNYRRAMAQAVSELETRPFSLNLLKQLHATLLDSVRGRDKALGRFRRCQNYVALPGEPIERASYVPPIWERVDAAMDNWERYIHADEKDPLVQLAIVKAQFELIHPFQDGNGRLGRMLVPILLFEKALLSSPMFYLSAYLEQHRDTYYYRLRAISEAGDWNGWVVFFLSALVDQARSNTRQAMEIIKLYERMKSDIPKTTRSQYAIQAIDALFDRPIFRRADFVQQSSIPRDSARRIFDVLRKEGVIQELHPGSGRRGAVMAFPELLGITKE